MSMSLNDILSPLRAILPVVAAVLMLLCTSCGRNEFDVRLDLPSSVSDTYTFLYYASDPEKGWLVEDARHPSKGKVEFRGITHNPTLVWILGAASSAPVAFYAERGDAIGISGKSADPLEWKISGNEITDALSDWRIANLKVLRASSSSPGSGAAVNKAVAAYVRGHESDPVSTLLLLLYYDRGADPEGFLSLWKSLDGDAAEAEWQQLVSRSDMIGRSPQSPPLPKQVVLKTADDDGMDTLRLTGRSLLLWFSRFSDSSDRSRDMARLRELKDKYHIVEVNADTDSLMWVRSLQADTLPGVVRAWMPLGVSDPVAVSLGINSIPCALLVSPQGKVLKRSPSLP